MHGTRIVTLDTRGGMSDVRGDLGGPSPFHHRPPRPHRRGRSTLERMSNVSSLCTQGISYGDVMGRTGFPGSRDMGRGSDELITPCPRCLSTDGNRFQGQRKKCSWERYRSISLSFKLLTCPQLQAFLLVSDMIDQSITCRDQPCWYRVTSV